MNRRDESGLTEPYRVVRRSARRRVLERPSNHTVYRRFFRLVQSIADYPATDPAIVFVYQLTKHFMYKPGHQPPSNP